MTEHVNRITHGTRTYTLVTSQRPLIGVAPPRGTKNLTQHNKSSREELASWEGDGGAARPPTQGL